MENIINPFNRLQFEFCSGVEFYFDVAHTHTGGGTTDFIFDLPLHLIASRRRIGEHSIQ